MNNNMSKNQAELEIEALANVFNLATDGFESFYKEAKSKTDADSRTAASSGDNSKAASSGHNSKAASSGYNSKAASSGNNSKAASSGHNSTAASSGYNSKAASSGYNSTAASSGDESKAASSGHNSTAASSGYNSTAASSGDNSTAASSGDESTAASSGDNSKAASSGDDSTAASSGEYSACSALGYRAAVKGELGNLIMASEYTLKDNRYIPIGGKADIVDGEILKAGSWYIVEDSKWVEVDFTDNVFSYVLSNKTGVRKVRTPEGAILFIVTDANGNSAHGETIAKAREDLVYKIAAKFDGKLPESAAGKDWVGLYRAITGACGAGVKEFIKRNNIDLDKNFTCNEIAKLVEGQFGEDKFKKVCKNE